ncbi:MAG: TRAP transporter substrate-binding protein [Sphaerochaetaceae bacterium]|nr:TRAP transporter substrate-binding protein [Sphaerochaetaceae bacterium]
MKKLIVLLLVMVLAVSFITAQGGSDAAEDKVITLKLGSSQNDGTAELEAAKEFARLLEEYSGGKMKCDVLGNGLAGGEREIVESQQLGTLDMSVVSGILQNFDPAMMILEYDLLFVSEDHAKEVFNGPVGEKIYNRLIDTAGIRILNMYMRTPRLMTTSRPINSTADLAGLKIRVPEMPARVALWKALGASPTPMAFTEVYTALQTGTIDGQENPISTIDSAKFYEAVDYLGVTNHVYGFMFINITEDRWQKLTDQQKEWVAKAAAESAVFNDRLAKEQENELMEKVSAQMTVTYPDTSSWRAMTRDVYKQFANVDGFVEIYSAIVEAGKKYE